MLHADERSAQARQYAGGRPLAVQVGNVDREQSRREQLGVTASELRDQPWGGERNFYFADPDGYTWACSQVMQGQSS